jgi:hypothetical protein
MASMKYVVAPSDDSTPPTLTVAMAVAETLLWELVGGIDGLGMVIPEGREKLGIERLETAGNDVAAGRMRVTAALAPWKAGRCVNVRIRRRQTRCTENR